MNEIVCINEIEYIPSGYVITIEEVWDKNHEHGWWMAKDSYGIVVHRSTPEKALIALRKEFQKQMITKAMMGDKICLKKRKITK